MTRQPARRPIGESLTVAAKKGVALLVLAVAALILFKVAFGLVISFVSAIVTIVLVIAAIVGVVWALSRLQRVGFLVFCAFVGIAGGIVGKIKGSSFFLWFIIAAIPPWVGLVAAVLYRYERDELRRQCPNCGKVLKLHDALCTRCGAELEFPEYAIAPESASPAR